jgi:signal transduction histidine kinase/ActR/RegA family two-component response regulator
MALVYFLYGLAFFLLGFLLFLYPKKDSTFHLAKNLWLIAAFGIFHGLNEWIDMFLLIHETAEPIYLKSAQLILIPLSFGFLLLFGTKTIATYTRNPAPFRVIPFALGSLWILLTLFSRNQILMGDLWARYIIAVPATFLSAYALFLEEEALKNLDFKGLTKNLILAAGAFVFYGIFAGLVGPAANVFPASLINTAVFPDLVGVPVQIFRTICAVIITYALIRVLNIFALETRELVRSASENLQMKVEESTASLRVINEQLQEEILDHKRTQEELRRAASSAQEEKARSEAIIAAIGDGISIQDKNYRVIYQNEVHQAILGDHIGSLCYAAFERRDNVCPDCPVALSFEDGHIHRTDRITTTESGIRCLSITASPLRNHTGAIVASIQVVRDITDQRKMESELVKIKKLESLGVMAGGIAHDFNNLLTTILGNISLVRYDIRSDHRSAEYLEEAEKGCHLAKDLTQQLLTFSKGGAPVRSKISIEELLLDVSRLTLSGSKAKCEFYLADDLWTLEADEGQIAQVIHNLLINADQAMPNGGTIHVSADNFTVPASTDLPLKRGKYVKVTVSDQGSGIAPEHMEQIFDPYFTMKADGNGLGLTIAHSIIQKHGGHIFAESGKSGTTFHFYLPASPITKVKEQEVPEEPLKGTGKILVMDDQKAVRDVACEILQSLGYEVELAEDGVQATRIYSSAKASGRPFDLVIMDLTIPGGMGGEETIRKLREIDPTVKAIVSSGYYDNPVMSRFDEFGFDERITKPFNVRELSTAVSRVLSRVS